MDETKQNDTADRRTTRPPRIRPDGKGEVADVLRATGHAYQVVHAQESAWVLYLRLASIDGDDTGVIQFLLRPGPDGVFYRRGKADYVGWDIPASGRE